MVTSMASLEIRWTNKGSKNYVDILPMTLFHSEVTNKEVEHLTRRPNGTTYIVKSTMEVRGNVATLGYSEINNPPNSVWPGITRITFETSERERALGVEWRDEGDTKFVDLLPVLSVENDQTNVSQFFVIKTDQIEMISGSISVYARPIFGMNGADISLGDTAFVWILEDKGGQGIEWYGVVQSLDKVSSDIHRIELRDLSRNTSSFGTTEIDKFRNSIDAHEAGLYRKLKTYSHRGIRRIDDKEAEKLLSLFSFDAFGNDAQSEVARLIRLGNVASRPNQAAFSANVRRAYEGSCAFTGCTTAEALEAAHIRVAEGVDDNDLRNGILLRADVHALFDKGLIALTLDGNRVQISTRLTDPSYDFLRTTKVSQPKESRPLETNIRHHRSRFGFERG
jgi:hypothetical protein